MPRRFLPRISYANVVATLALILALGGVSHAAVKINGKNIKNRTVGAVKIKKNSLGGNEINEAKLGKVPLATHADDADTVGGKLPSTFKLSCPQGTAAVIGECFETSLRTPASWSDANKTCGAAGRRVPTLAELEAARQNNFTVGEPPNNYEMSSSVYNDGMNRYFSTDPGGNLIGDPFATQRPYRCIQNPSN